MTSQRFHEVGTADDDSGLRAAEELVAGEADEIGAGVEALPRSRLVADVHQGAGAEIVDEWQIVQLCDSRELLQAGQFRESDNPEVGLVDPQDERRLGTDCGVVVRGTRAIRRADLAQARTRAYEDIGNPESVADLDQLAA